MVLHEQMHDADSETANGKGSGIRGSMYQALRERRMERQGLLSGRENSGVVPARRTSVSPNVVEEQEPGRIEGGRRPIAGGKRGAWKGKDRRGAKRAMERAGKQSSGRYDLVDLDAGGCNGGGSAVVVVKQNVKERRGQDTISLI